MNLDHNRQAEAQHRTPDREAAIARYYRDFLLGRALPADDHLATLFDSLERSDADGQAARSDAAGSGTVPELRH